MIPAWFASSAALGLVADHLWQSTLFAAVVALLALAFRRNRAHVRYGLWLAASVKFLIPFAGLAALGRMLEWRTTTLAPPELTVALDGFAQPFSGPSPVATAALGAGVPSGAGVLPAVIASIWFIGCALVTGVWVLRWRRVSAAARAASRLESGRVHDTMRRLEALARITRPTALASSEASLEPGVFGILRPVLLWPRGIDARLDDAQVETILAHEIAHVRRRDNLTAAVHMLVEALFWFHPLTWWIGTRLLDERERACDEEVVRLGSDPHAYAESILKTCQFCIESPLACVAGVTGSNLGKRIEAIMTHDSSHGLTLAKRVLLAAAAVTATVGPVAVGVLTGPRLEAQVVAPAANAPVFEAASVRPSPPGGRVGGRGTPGRFTGTGLSVRRMIRQAYEIHDSQIIGGPDWLASQGYDVNATTGDKPPDQMADMMKTLLRDRFKLTFHTEKRELATYNLVVARSDGRLGPGLRRTPEGECVAPGTPRQGGAFDPSAGVPCGAIMFGPGSLRAHGVTISMLVRTLGNLPAVTSFNRIVTDQTKLEGTYDFDFKFANDFGPGGPPGGGAGATPTPADEPALFTALQELLGLKLNPERETLDVMVIDSVERPAEN